MLLFLKINIMNNKCNFILDYLDTFIVFCIFVRQNENLLFFYKHKPNDES